MAGVNTLRLSVRGTLLGPDIFDWSMWFTPSGTATVPSDAATAAALLAEITGASTWTALLTKAQTLMGTTDAITSIAQYTYPTGGTHAATAVNTPVSLAGTGGTRLLPNQCAVVVSLRSPFAGRNNRGRFFLPLTAGGITAGSTSQIVNTQTAAIAAAVANFMSHMNGASFANLGGNALRPCVSSRGSNALISTVVVDSVIDTQRRRRNKVTPTVVSTAPILIGP